MPQSSMLASAQTQPNYGQHLEPRNSGKQSHIPRPSIPHPTLTEAVHCDGPVDFKSSVNVRHPLRLAWALVGMMHVVTY
jgi:hypothetical protein